MRTSLPVLLGVRNVSGGKTASAQHSMVGVVPRLHQGYISHGRCSDHALYGAVSKDTSVS